MREPASYPEGFDISNYSQQKLFEEIPMDWILEYLHAHTTGSANRHGYSRLRDAFLIECGKQATFKDFMEKGFYADLNAAGRDDDNMCWWNNVGQGSIKLLHAIFDTYMSKYKKHLFYKPKQGLV